MVITYPSGSVGEPKIFEPYTRVRLPNVLGDVGGRLEALWEWRSPDTPAKGPWSRAIRARTPIILTAAMPRERFTAPLDGPTGARVTCPRRRLKDIIIVSGLMPVADDATSILVRTGPFVYRRSV